MGGTLKPACHTSMGPKWLLYFKTSCVPDRKKVKKNKNKNKNMAPGDFSLHIIGQNCVAWPCQLTEGPGIPVFSFAIFYNRGSQGACVLLTTESATYSKVAKEG